MRERDRWILICVLGGFRLLKGATLYVFVKEEGLSGNCTPLRFALKVGCARDPSLDWLAKEPSVATQSEQGLLFGCPSYRAHAARANAYVDG